LIINNASHIYLDPLVHVWGVLGMKYCFCQISVDYPQEQWLPCQRAALSSCKKRSSKTRQNKKIKNKITKLNFHFISIFNCIIIYWPVEEFIFHINLRWPFFVPNYSTFNNRLTILVQNEYTLGELNSIRVSDFLRIENKSPTKPFDLIFPISTSHFVYKSYLIPNNRSFSDSLIHCCYPSGYPWPVFGGFCKQLKEYGEKYVFTFFQHCFYSN